MALEKQHVSVPFQAGHNSQRDRKLLPNGALSRAENVRFDEEMRLVKRYGYSDVTLEDTNGFSLDADVYSIFQRGAERCMLGSGRLYSQLDAGDAFEDVDAAQEIGHVSNQVVYRKGARNIHYIDAATGNGLICYVWVESSGIWTGGSASVYGDVWAMVVDEATGTVIERVSIETGDLFEPKIVPCGNGWMISYVESSGGSFLLKVVYKAWALPLASGWGTPTTLSSVVATASGVWASYDMDAYAQFAYIAFNNTSATTTVLRVNTLKAITHTVTVSYDSLQGIGVSAQAERVWVAMGNNSGAVYTTHSLATAAVSAGPTTLDSSGNQRKFFSWGRDGSTQMRLFYGRDECVAATVDASGTVTPLFTTYNVNPVSRVESSTGKFYLVVQTALSTLITAGVDTSHTYLCEIGSSGLTPVGVLCRFSAPQPDMNLGVNIQMGNILTLASGFGFAAGNLYQSLDRDGYEGQSGLERWDWTFRNRESQLPVEYKDTVYFSGGIITQYDGQLITELGFCWAPEIELSQSATSGSLTTGQSYGVVATYEWTDSAGNRHVSLPSVQKNLTPTGTSIDVKICNLTLSRKGNVEIHLYVTDGNGTIPKRVTLSTVGVISNDATAATQTFNLGTSTGLDILYTIGGVVENTTCLSAQHLLAHKSRLWVASDRNLYYSKLDTLGIGIELAEEFQLRLPDEPIKALAALDDSTVAFQESRIYATYGDGPNDRGEGQFADPVKLPADYGCTNPRSVVTYQQGVLFEGPRGPHVIPRGLGSPVWIGGRVRDFFSTTPGTALVTGAHVVPTQHHVRVCLSTGDILCLDYRMGELGEWTNYTLPSLSTILAAGVWDGYHVVSDGGEADVRKETRAYADTSLYITSTIETGDIRLAGVQGYKRVWRTLLLGEYQGACQVTMSVAYDGDDSYTVTSDAWVPSGSAGDQVEFAWHMRRQQVESVRIKLADAETGESGTTAGLVWNGLTFEVGMQRGAQRIAPGNRSS